MKYLSILKEHSVKKRNNVAIVDRNGSRETTYFELECLSNKIANKLKNNGYNNGDVIIIKLDRCMEYAASELGVIKINATFIPVMIDYPKDRIEYIIKDSKAKLVIDEKFFSNINDYSDEFNFIEKDDGLATILYTSGSTGKPKGVCWSKKAFEAALERSDAIYSYLKEIKYGAATPMTFVATYHDLHGVLRKGGTTHILPDDVRKDTKNLVEYFDKYNITCTFISPRLHQFFKSKNKNLEMVIVGGERVVNQYNEDYKLLNIYGQTEGWLYATLIIDKKYDNTPIGKALPGIEIKLLDENGNEVKKGEEGEICPIGILPDSYNNLPELSKRVFEKTNDGRVMIHTGDIGKILPDGNLLYVNRNDFMIKLHGQRVEPGEIEAIMNDVSNVTGAVAKAFEKDDGSMVFCGFYTANIKIDKEIIIKALESKLPNYMIPTIFYQMEKFPLNQNGKIDRKNIVLPDMSLLIGEYEKPENELEEKICSAFSKVMNIEKIGRNTNFFEVGGNSINAIKLVKEINIDGLSTQFVFLAKTPMKIAKLYEKNKNIIKPSIVKRKINIDNINMTNAQKYQYDIATVFGFPMDIMDFNYFYDIGKDIDVDKLKNAIYDTINNHKIYTTNVSPVLTKEMFIGSSDFKVNILNLSEEEFEKYRIDKYNNIRNYEKDTMLFIDIVKCNRTYYFCYGISHFAMDGASQVLFLEEITNRYNGSIDKIRKETIDIFDIAIYEKEVKNTLFYKEAEKFYDNMYKDVEDAGIENKKLNIMFVEQILDVKESKFVENVAMKYDTTEAIILQYAFEKAVKKFINKDKFAYIILANSRDSIELENVHGCLATGIYVSTSINDKNNDYQNINNISDKRQNAWYYNVIEYEELLKKYKKIDSNITFNYHGETLSKEYKFGDNIIKNNFQQESFKYIKAFAKFNVGISKNSNGYSIIYFGMSYTREEVNKFIEFYKEEIFNIK